MDEKEELIDNIQAVNGGRLPSNVRNVLSIIVHPDVIESTKDYIRVHDVNTRCLNYEYPWSCIREAEAKYKNIKYGWLAGSSGIGYDESWCENCRKKVMDA